MHPLGLTRTSVQHDHAFIAPDSHVQADLPGWSMAQGTVLISPHMGARFSQYYADLEPGGTSAPPLPGVSRFVYVQSGAVALTVGLITEALRPGTYAYLPPDTAHSFAATEATRLIIFEKPYVPLAGTPPPSLITGHTDDIQGEPFMGDEDAVLQTLLPTTPSFDMAVNLFSFQPGAALPFVEAHVMEHGLSFVQGQGVYRLADRWYPIQAGDTIWMASYCPQWFCAIGKTPSAYLYYKDVQRDPLAPGT